MSSSSSSNSGGGSKKRKRETTEPGQKQRQQQPVAAAAPDRIKRLFEKLNGPPIILHFDKMGGVANLPPDLGTNVCFIIESPQLDAEHQQSCIKCTATDASKTKMTAVCYPCTVLLNSDAAVRDQLRHQDPSSDDDTFFTYYSFRIDTKAFKDALSKMCGPDHNMYVGVFPDSVKLVIGNSNSKQATIFNLAQLEHRSDEIIGASMSDMTFDYALVTSVETLNGHFKMMKTLCSQVFVEISILFSKDAPSATAVKTCSLCLRSVDPSKTEMNEMSSYYPCTVMALMASQKLSPESYTAIVAEKGAPAVKQVIDLHKQDYGDYLQDDDEDGAAAAAPGDILDMVLGMDHNEADGSESFFKQQYPLDSIISFLDTGIIKGNSVCVFMSNDYPLVLQSVDEASGSFTRIAIAQRNMD